MSYKCFICSISVTYVDKCYKCKKMVCIKCALLNNHVDGGQHGE